MIPIRVLAVCISAAFSQLAAGALITIDMDSSTAGIQNTLNVAGGAPVSIDIIIDINEPTGLGNYSFSVNYDSSLLSITGISESPIPGFTDFAPTDFATPGLVSFIDGFDGGGPVTPINFNGVVATLTFNAANVTGSGSVAPFLDINFDGFFDDNGAPIAVSFASGSINVTAASVPEPSTMSVLFALVSGSLWRFRRRSSVLA